MGAIDRERLSTALETDHLVEVLVDEIPCADVSPRADLPHGGTWRHLASARRWRRTLTCDGSL